MSVNDGLGDSFPSSSFFGNVNFKFDISPTEFDQAVERRGVCPEDKKSDSGSIISFHHDDDFDRMSRKFQIGLSDRVLSDRVDDQLSRGFLESKPSASGSLATSASGSSSSEQLEGKTKEEDGYRPRKRSKNDADDDFDLGNSSRTSSDGKSMPPMETLLKKLAEEIKNEMIENWTEMFSKMESFESEKLNEFEEILAATLAYEEQLKKEKSELREFLMKLSEAFIPE